MAAKSELRQWYESGRDRVIPRDPPVAPPHWMRYAIALCRDGSDGLARYFKQVPASHLRGGHVECVCEQLVGVPDGEFVECPGGCGRWFLRDGPGVWAARLPVEAVDEPAAA
jgi:hypothetical protein